MRLEGKKQYDCIYCQRSHGQLMVRNVLDAKEKNISPYQEFAKINTASKKLMNVFTL